VQTAPLDTASRTRRLSATIIAVVVALLIVPTLIRAAGPLVPDDHGAPLLRLNRGVDVPESKCRVTGAFDHVAIIDAHTVREIRWFERTVFQRCSADPLPDSPPSRPPVLRGPPLFT
jgi:hypothetical protein